ncbi:MAG TPA: tetratricopeptide repeat protein [Longimicrobiales bacterium]|nr:tetratricopeptide repeat protein [Longimicrobiales bacterium]
MTNRRTKGRKPATTMETVPEAGESPSTGPGAAESVAEARRRAVENPTDVAARLELARLYREGGDLALAREQLESARGEAPENADVLLDMGITLAAMGRHTEAERELRGAQRLAPDRAAVHVQLGIALFKRGLVREAEAVLKRALELDDQNADAYFYRGEALNQLGHVDDALEMLERAVQYQPRNARAYYTMGILYDRKHLRQEATTMYRKAREVGAA